MSMQTIWIRIKCNFLPINFCFSDFLHFSNVSCRVVSHYIVSFWIYSPCFTNLYQSVTNSGHCNKIQNELNSIESMHNTWIYYATTLAILHFIENRVVTPLANGKQNRIFAFCGFCVRHICFCSFSGWQCSWKYWNFVSNSILRVRSYIGSGWG